MASAKKAATSSSKGEKAQQAKQANTVGYKGHLAGRRKGKVHELFDKQGAEAAWTLGLKLRLKQGTLRSWFGAWGSKKSRKPTPKASDKANPPKTASGVAAISEASQTDRSAIGAVASA
jgi:hypothetical protein